MIRVMIVDDEPHARESARIVLERDADVVVVASCSGVDAAQAVAETRPDLMFLDVQMPVMDGFDVLTAIGPDLAPEVVFVTAYDQYAVRAFEVHALDYVLKPFDDRRLLAAMARAKERLVQRSGSAESLADLVEQHEHNRDYVQRFVVRERGRTVLVAAADVDWLEAAGDYVSLHVGDTVHLIRERLSRLEERLDPGRFARIHRSTMVNLERVQEIRPLLRGDARILLQGGARLRVSRSRRAELMRRLSHSSTQGDDSPHRS